MLLFTPQVCRSFIVHLLLCFCSHVIMCYEHVWGVNVQIPSAERHFFFKYTAILAAHLGVRWLSARWRSDRHLASHEAGRRFICSCDKNASAHSNVVTRTLHRSIRLVLVECESALRSDNRLGGRIPQTKRPLCSALRNLGDAPTNRVEFFFLPRLTNNDLIVPSRSCLVPVSS